MPGILFLQDFPIVFEAVLLSVLALDKNPILPFGCSTGFELPNELPIALPVEFPVEFPLGLPDASSA